MPSDDGSNSTKYTLIEVPVLKNVLIIDRDESSVQLLKTILEFYDFTVFCSHRYPEIKKIFKNYTIDVVIADMIVPGINSLLLVHKIRQDQHIPVLITSIKELSSSERKDLLKLDIPFIQKPFSTTVLFEKIKETEKGFKS